MTGIINWFKTIFILEITGEIALKLVPLKYKEFIAFVMKLILVTAIIIPLLNIKNADISEITDGISNGLKTAEKIISSDINSTAASYGLEAVYVKCSFTSDMTAVSMINVYVKDNSIAGNDNIGRLRTDIADRYGVSVEQVDIREAGESG